MQEPLVRGLSEGSALLPRRHFGTACRQLHGAASTFLRLSNHGGRAVTVPTLVGSSRPAASPSGAIPLRPTTSRNCDRQGDRQPTRQQPPTTDDLDAYTRPELRRSGGR